MGADTGACKKKRKEKVKGKFPTNKLALEFHDRFYAFEAFLLPSLNGNTHKVDIKEVSKEDNKYKKVRDENRTKPLENLLSSRYLNLKI